MTEMEKASDVLARYRDPGLVTALAESIRRRFPGHPVRFMHVCGTHEHAIGEFGIRDILPSWLRVIAGPGCPVCVCPAADIDLAAHLALERGIILATFGDIVRVPAPLSLSEAKARGADIRVVYSAADAVSLARNNPTKEIVFFAVGFETTACTIAAALAADPGPNFSILCSHRLIPPALEALLSMEGPPLSGYVLPGHVMTVTGTEDYAVFPEKYGIPLVVAGFEPVDILFALDTLLEKITTGRPSLYNAYPRAVRPQGNRLARELLRKIFEPCDAPWRGIGTIPRSGLRLREEYKHHDALLRFGVHPDPHIPDIEPGCSCHLIMLGRLDPPECPLFARRCIPERPVGPCMVSMEGTCHAWYRHRKSL